MSDILRDLLDNETVPHAAKSDRGLFAIDVLELKPHFDIVMEARWIP